MILDLLVSDIVDESMIRSSNRVFIFGLNNDALIIKRELQKLGIVNFGYMAIIWICWPNGWRGLDAKWLLKPTERFKHR